MQENFPENLCSAALLLMLPYDLDPLNVVCAIFLFPLGMAFWHSAVETMLCTDLRKRTNEATKLNGKCIKEDLLRFKYF